MTPAQILQHHDEARLWPASLDLSTADAYARALSVRALRIARGEQPRGFKVGFTNRNLWPLYGVDGPIWGTVYDRTLMYCDGAGVVSLAASCQPRIEPECVFGLAATPPVGATPDQLLASVAWIAPGFEIVQSHRPGWKFAASDAVADGALHGCLLVGQRVPARDITNDARATDARTFDATLAAARVVLHKNRVPVEAGAGANVLDGPLHALHHFLQALSQCPGAPELQAGDVVTTGTWTDAWPVASGETWTAAFDAPLGRLEVRFS